MDDYKVSAPSGVALFSLYLFFGMKTSYLILKLLGGLSDGCKVENAIPNIT